MINPQRQRVRLRLHHVHGSKRLSKIALILAEHSDRLGLHDDAARLFDLSGHDDKLAAYLNGRIQAVSDVEQDCPNGRIQAHLGQESVTVEEVAAVNERLRALISAREAAGVAGGGMEGAGVGGAAAYAYLFRRASLLAGVSRLPQVRC